MRLYFFRQTAEIPVEDVKSLANMALSTMGIDATVFEECVNEEASKTDIGKLLRISDSYTERTEPVVAVVFTKEKPADGAIARNSPDMSRGAWVNADGSEAKTFLLLMHELGHIFDAEHCTKKDCLMYPYYPQNSFNETSLEDLFCFSCLQKIKESWIFNRLLCSAKKRSNESKLTVDTIASEPEEPATNPPEKTDKSVKSERETEREKPSAHDRHEHKSGFPDWTLPKEEFIRKVKEYFCYQS